MMTVNDFIINIFYVSSILSIFILMTLAITPFLNKRYHATWRFYVWITYAIFLISPSYVIFKRYHLAEFVSPDLVITNNNLEIPKPTLIIAEGNSVAGYSQKVSLLDYLISNKEIIIYIWAIIVVLYGSYLAIIYICSQRSIKRWSNPLPKETLNLLNRYLSLEDSKKVIPPIYICRKVSSPMIVGLISPRIVLPQVEYTMDDLTIIIEHELMHYERHDLWYKFFFLLVRTLHWFNPFVHYMVNEANNDIELCCDRDLLNSKGLQYKDDYSSVILNGVIFTSKKENLLSASLGSKTKFLKKRLKQIYDVNEKKGKLFIISIITILLLTQTIVFAGESPIFNFADPQYKQLLQKVISEKEKEMQKEAKNTKGILISPEVLNRNKNDDGTYDYKTVLKEMKLKPRVYKEHEALKTYKYSAIKGSVGPHVLANGEESVYCKGKENGWLLKKGNIVKLTIYADSNYFTSNGNFYIGYIKDNKHHQVENATIKDRKEIEISIPENGEYEFYLFCASMNPIIVKQINLEFKKHFI